MKPSDKANYFGAPEAIIPCPGKYNIWIQLDRVLSLVTYNTKQEAVTALRDNYIGGVVYGPTGRPVYAK